MTCPGFRVWGLRISGFGAFGPWVLGFSRVQDQGLGIRGLGFWWGLDAYG